MKRFIFYAIIALITISCNRPDSPLVIPRSIDAQTPLPDPNRETRGCQIESWDDSEMGDRTYAVVDPDNPDEYFQYWSDGDAISVFYTTANLKYALTSYRTPQNVSLRVGRNNINIEFSWT